MLKRNAGNQGLAAQISHRLKQVKVGQQEAQGDQLQHHLNQLQSCRAFLQLSWSPALA
jgi:hypothetical protein